MAKITEKDKRDALYQALLTLKTEDEFYNFHPKSMRIGRVPGASSPRGSNRKLISLAKKYFTIDKFKKRVIIRLIKRDEETSAGKRPTASGER